MQREPEEGGWREGGWRESGVLRWLMTTDPRTSPLALLPPSLSLSGEADKSPRNQAVNLSDCSSTASGPTLGILVRFPIWEYFLTCVSIVVLN